jgi:hypothetical protein
MTTAKESGIGAWSILGWISGEQRRTTPSFTELRLADKVVRGREGQKAFLG